MLITHDGWWSGTVGVADLALCFQCNVWKRKISLFREIELIWVKAVAIETFVSLIQSDCLWVPWEQKSSADHNGGQPGCNWTSQIWNVAHCLGALDRGISQICSNIILNWQIVDFPRYLDATSRWKKSINFCQGVYTLSADGWREGQGICRHGSVLVRAGYFNIRLRSIQIWWQISIGKR